MSAKPEVVEDAKPPAKSKKMLIIIIGAVLLLVLAGGGAFFYITKQRAAAAAAEEGDTGGEKPAAKAAAHGPPAYLPLDNMVVNLADPGGERVAQIGITLEVTDAHAVDTVKAVLPTIRSGILEKLSVMTAEELLTLDGKDKLKKTILREASLPFGGGEEDTSEKGKKAAKKSEHAEVPVVGVLFSSFIVQ